MGLAPMVLLAWTGVVFVLYALLRPRTALLTSVVAGLLFLPVHEVDLPFLPSYSKTIAISFAPFLCGLLFDSASYRSLRPSPVDIPMLVWIASPFASSIANDLGPYDGVSAVLNQALVWGVPYFLGRVYLKDIQDLRAAAVALVIGGLAYIPFILIEAVMSPQLHRWVYGFHQHQFVQTVRYGGFRPMVFMNHGLMVAFWMAGSAVAAFWLWRTRSMPRLVTLPMGMVVLALVAGTFLCRSVNGLIVLTGGIAMLAMVRWTRSAIPVGAVLVIASTYLLLRSTGLWSGAEALNLVSSTFGEERAQSLETRLSNETELSEKAWERPMLGWGRWGRSRILDEYGNDISTVDGRWIINLGQAGLVGLSAYLLVFLIAIGRSIVVLPVSLWSHPMVVGVGVSGVLLALVTLDDLMNAFVNPFYWLLLGGLASLRPATIEAGVPEELPVGVATKPVPVASEP